MASNIRNFLIQRLEKAELLAKGSLSGRFLFNPFKYIYIQFFKRITYAKTKKGRLVNAKTVWGHDIQLLLPAGIDIYLLGAKTHDSEFRLSKFIARNLSPGDIFIDAGAHFGFYSLLASFIMQKEGLVLSFEASEQIFSILNQNTSKHSIVKRFHRALTSTDDQMIEFTEFPILFSEFNTLHSEQFENTEWYKKNNPKKIKVNTARIDSILPLEISNCKSLGTDSKYFIKIDVEGAEFEVLKGCSKILEQNALKNKVYIVIEYWGSDNKQEQHDLAVNYLKNHGYNPYIIDKNGELYQIEDLNSVKHSDNIVFF